MDGDQALGLAWQRPPITLDKRDRLTACMIVRDRALKCGHDAGECLALGLAAGLNSRQIGDVRHKRSIRTLADMNDAIENGHRAGRRVNRHVVGLECENETPCRYVSR